MAFTARQLRAIGYCAKKYDQRLSLCTPPHVYYIRRDTGETLRVHINDVLSTYDQGRKEDAKERARSRKENKHAKHSERITNQTI